ncbi:MAG TPA: TAT-variant-translocated molybdopterin oxidoreductase [Bryobacteraceae bacterium]|nr:TAT-variant-translocated molybdopterin oxidoreductase [Bryobacteraceae bacterium]
MEKHYWRSLAECENRGELAAAAEPEFAESPAREIEAGPSRRGFLKAAGFALAGGALAGCSRAPGEKAIPYAAQPEGLVAGRAQYYASTCGACTAGCGLLAKVRDGRPIKLEGNREQAISRGATCAAGQASILGLYDSYRLKQPLAGGKPATWEGVDRAVLEKMERIRAGGGAVRYLSETVTSPAKQAAIDRFLAQFRDARHVMYDAVSASAILDAHERTHGARVLPHYRFERADVIAAFDADFLGTWISPVEFARDYAARRMPPNMSWHVQFEGRLSLTGSKADRRIRTAPGEIAGRLAQLAAFIESNGAGGDDLAARLLQARGRSLVVCGVNDLDAQLWTNYINHLLGNYGATLDIERASLQRRGSDRDLADLLAELKQGQVAALFIDAVNPVADLPGVAGLDRIGLFVSFAGSVDETAERAHYICPDHHYLESWADAEPVAGLVSLTQPAIRPLGSTRAAIETLAAWSGHPAKAYDLIREYWKDRFDWDRALEAGFAEVPRTHAAAPRWIGRKPAPPAAATPGYAVDVYAAVGMPGGRHAYNPFLHELPDPITKTTWDNCALLSPAAAASLGVGDGDILRIEAGAAIEVPLLVQPGQHDQVVSVALGYGRKASERFANLGPRWINHKPTINANGRVGANAAPLLAFEHGLLRYQRGGAVVAKTGRRIELALTQTHHTLSVPKHLAPAGGEVRPIVREIAPAELGKPEHAETHEELWPDDHPYNGHRWGMAVDLNACNGCSACVIACQVENNTPVVGKDEVRRRREMHWIRIDRYYSGPPEDVRVAHQPMMCQQCDHAPCETVCPTLATVHSDEGLNQQIYNRCVGTRYCANNCPYKARRFNWFDYPREDRLANLLLNPDVTVRSRGVMEKCTFCVQRIQEAKIEARRNGAPVRDGEIHTACEQACPAGAIVFGDLNDPSSRVSRLAHDARQYRVLDELNVRPSVHYLKIVRDEKQQGEKHHG